MPTRWRPGLRRVSLAVAVLGLATTVVLAAAARAAAAVVTPSDPTGPIAFVPPAPAPPISIRAGDYTITIGDLVSANLFYDRRDVGGYEGFFLTPAQEDDGNFNIDAGQTRFSLGASGPGFLGGTVSGLVAVDFLKSAEDGTSQNSLRLYYAWLEGDWPSTPLGRLQVRVGQTVTPLASLIPDTVDDTPGYNFGVLYAREAQLRVTHTFGTPANNIQFAWALSEPNSGVFGTTASSGPGAFGGDNDRTGTANAGEVPWGHAQLRWTTDVLGLSDFGPAFVAVSGFYGRERYEADDLNAPVAAGGLGASLPGSRNIRAWAAQLAFSIPIIPAPGGTPQAGTLGLRAAGHIGENVDSFFGGGLQGVSLDATGTGLDAVQSLGGWVMARLFMTSKASVYGMAGYLEANHISGPLVSGIDTDNRKNRELLGGVDYRFTERVFTAIEYSYKESDFRTPGNGTGVNNRVLWSWKYFF